MKMKTFFVIVVCLLWGVNLAAEDGHKLWLRSQSTGAVDVVCSRGSVTLDIARHELQQGWQGKSGGSLVLTVKPDQRIKGDGFILRQGEIQANTDAGILYGVYELLRRQQTGQPLEEEIFNPSYERRILNHWDFTIPNSDFPTTSIFWRGGKDALTVTDEDKALWQEYARANASVGINGVVPNMVNASPQILTRKYLERVKGLADVLRHYGIKTYLSVNILTPSVIGGLKTSDPTDPKVNKWWKAKVKEIYTMIPDFGGFLVKANSEAEPGPEDFGRTHADGANVLADALKPFGGIVMWRAFVYKSNDTDRVKQAYSQFMPLDGLFRDNVIVQVKNGPIDFQPREPFHPLFGAMKKTALMPELQIAQEYLGQSIHLVFLAPMWEEFFKSDTWQHGKGSTVARCTDGSINPQKHTAVAGVSNIDMKTDWCGHPFAQANWYAFGRLSWNNTLTSEQIADEWIKLTFYPFKPGSAGFSDDWVKNFLTPVKQMMLESREAAVNYMMPLGLHHLFASYMHYGPGPWWAPENTRKDWTPPYYHQADINGIGFDRTEKGSNAVSQYHKPLDSIFNDVKTCPEKFLLWFHHLPWDYQMKSGRTLWDELCYHYDSGLQQVREFQKVWDRGEAYIDPERFAIVQSKLREQCLNAQIWKDACLLYFQQFSKKAIPYDIERPVHDLDDLIKADMKHYKNQ